MRVSLKFVPKYPFFQQREIPICLIQTKPVSNVNHTSSKRYRRRIRFTVKTVFSRENGRRLLGCACERKADSCFLASPLHTRESRLRRFAPSEKNQKTTVLQSKLTRKKGENINRQIRVQTSFPAKPLEST